MYLKTPIRLSMLLFLAAPLCAQSTRLTPAPAAIPPTPPTAAVPPQPVAPAPLPPNRAKITYLDSQLTVSADNSSLNQILHEISRLAGITITGGVAEERVFGDYGPGTPAQVLGQLLDGTASNMLFVGNTGDKAPELILTPRTGGPTPPNPNAMRFNDTADSDSQQADQPPPPPDPAATEVRPGATPAVVNTPPTPTGAETGTTPAGSPPADPNGQSPNGTRTPQQIYDQLMKLRQQQQQQQPQN